jgi:hypothetical protein
MDENKKKHIQFYMRKEDIMTFVSGLHEIQMEIRIILKIRLIRRSKNATIQLGTFHEILFEPESMAIPSFPSLLRQHQL